MVFASPIFLALFLPATIACYFVRAAGVAQRRADRREPRLLRVGRGGLRAARAGVRARELGARARDRPGAPRTCAQGPTRGCGRCEPLGPRGVQVRELRRRPRQRRARRVRPRDDRARAGATCRSASRSSRSRRSATSSTSTAAMPAPRSLLDFALYVSLFPQLDRRADRPLPRRRAEQLAATRGRRRRASRRGVCRFASGSARRCWSPNPLARRPPTRVFALPRRRARRSAAPGSACLATRCRSTSTSPATPTWPSAWAACSASRFLENFNSPVLSPSVTEFWRRWHISLSTWFRDYLYIPLGGNRGGAVRAYVNLVHRVPPVRPVARRDWTFVIWGAVHGVFLVIERMGLARVMGSWPQLLRHLYLLLVVMVGWVFFRANTLPDAVGMLKAMAGLFPTRRASSIRSRWVRRRREHADDPGRRSSGLRPLFPRFGAGSNRCPDAERRSEPERSRWARLRRSSSSP